MNEFNVLLVDDEKFDLEIMRAAIPWKILGFEIAGCAFNASEAMDILGRKQVDLVISDIQMPVESGLVLLARVRERYAHVRTIFISGHEEFAYVQQALNMGASGYVLKPVDGEELARLLTRVHAEIMDARGLQRAEAERNIADELENRTLKAILADEVRTYVSRHIMRSMTVSDLARHFCYSANYLSAQYRQETGEALSAYLIRARLEYAAKRLAEGDVRVADLAAAMGYSSTSYFIQLFKDKYGMTPKQYQVAKRIRV